MHNLEQSIAEWRKTVLNESGVGREIVDELETHLRETVEQLIRSGAAAGDAFDRAVSQIGPPVTVATEFRKLSPTAWLPAKVLATVGVVEALALAVCSVAAFHRRPSDPLLLAHVLSVTLGYSTAFLLGLLGSCFVCQRCCSEFPARRLESIARATASFARVAAGLTATGIVLGMLWSKCEWGRFWGWSPKEIGALCIMVWLVGFLCAHRFRWVPPRGIVVLNILTGSVVGLGWLGPSLAPAAHVYGRASLSGFLTTVVIADAVVFLVGMAPAGWLRRRKA